MSMDTSLKHSVTAAKWRICCGGRVPILSIHFLTICIRIHRTSNSHSHLLCIATRNSNNNSGLAVPA